MPCPFCNSNLHIATPFPKNRFNNKEFEYIRCNQCRLVYLNIFPDQKDYEAMYLPSYQGSETETGIQTDPYIKEYGLRFSYGYQFDIIKQNIGSTAKVLDYGCGTGHFVGNAVHYGLTCDGAEFNPEYVALLKKSFSTSNFFITDDILKGRVTDKYDVVRLSNVLEHLVTPGFVIEKLKALLNPGGLLLVEGPIEDNFSIAESFRKLYFRIGKWIHPHRIVSAPPYHIFFSNIKNQQQFFNNCGLEEIHFKTAEEAWPFPDSFHKAKGVQGVLTTIIAKVSKWITNAIGRNWGNVFIYCGRVK